MESAKDEVEFVHINLIERLTDINNLLFKPNEDDEKINKYTKITSYVFLSCAVEALIGLIIKHKYKQDNFVFNFVNKKNKFSGALLEFDLLESLLSGYDVSKISVEDFKNEFYPVCEGQIKYTISQSGENFIFDNESFKDVYRAVKDERNKISHEFYWSKNNFTSGMLIKFLKVYYTVYKVAIFIISDEKAIWY